MTIFFIFLFVLLTGLVRAEEDQAFELTIDNIMEGPTLTGEAPKHIRWSLDGKSLYFEWKKPGEKRAELYVAGTSDLTPKKIKIPQALKNPPLASPVSSRRYYSFRFDRSALDLKFDRKKEKALQIENGDINLLIIKTGKVIQLTATDERETDANFTYDGEKVYFTSQSNLFILSLDNHSLQQLTSFTKKPSPPPQKPDKFSQWLRSQQKSLFKVLQKPPRKRFSDRTNLSFGTKKRRKPYTLNQHQNIIHLEPSPDEQHVFFRLREEAPDAIDTVVPDYVTRSGYTEDIQAHPKAAYPSYRTKAGIMSPSSGEIKWVDFNQGERNISSRSISCSPDGKKYVLKAQSDDRKDAWLFLLDIQTGKTSVIEHVHDEAWIGELGLTNIVWWHDSLHVSYISEKDGYAHLYKTSLDGKESQQLTSGKFEVYQAQLSRDHKKWYLTSNEEHPGEKHFYSMPAEGGRRIKMTSLTGQNEAFLSPGEKFLAVLHSKTNHPPELYLQRFQPGAEAHQIFSSTTEAFQSYAWREPSVITFKARDGVDVYARLFRPEEWHPEKPAVIFIHGAGYLQNAHKGWSEYYREYMFHNYLMTQGYMVLDVDYRGSEGYGRDCRTAIYRHMGGKDLDDIVDGAKYLVNEHGANPEKLGVYGGSYGGFLTFMAMFTEPDVFQAGAALRPVTDWAHYHNHYTQDILNLPQEDPESFERSSPIYFAEGLKGALLICHGMVDTNVHFQDTVRLVQRLIELRKENWEVAIYPAEGHSFDHPSSWADEYKRIFQLFENNLK